MAATAIANSDYTYDLATGSGEHPGQPSHWLYGVPYDETDIWIGIMEAPSPDVGISRLVDGSYLQIADIRAFDVMGYNIVIAGLTPPPGESEINEPVEGVELPVDDVLLSWLPGAYAEKYTVIVEDWGPDGQGPAVAVLDLEDTTGTSTVLHGNMLLPGRVYLWYVNSENWRGYVTTCSWFTTTPAPDPHGSWSTNFTSPPPDEEGSGTGLTGSVESFCAFDDGEGLAVYAGGWLFGAADGENLDPGDGIARWDGAAWSALATDPTNFDAPGGVYRYNGGHGLISAMTTFDPDGAGTAWGTCLVLGGEFTNAGASFTDSTAVSNIALYRRSDRSFHPLGAGISEPFPYQASIKSLVVFDDDGAGPHPASLYAAGEFEFECGTYGTAKGVARYDAATDSWRPVGAGLVYGTQDPYDTDGEASVCSLCVFDDGTGPHLYAGGFYMTKSGTNTLHNLARWSGSAWESVGSGVTLNADDAVAGVLCMTAFDDDGEGPNAESLFVGGTFDHAGAVGAWNLAKWDGSAWSNVGDMTGGNYYPPSVKALTVFDGDGPGPQTPHLYAGGLFFFAGGHPVNHIARLDEDGWHALGGGIAFPSLGGEFVPSVHSLTPAVTQTDGHGALYVGGFFTEATGAESTFIARWTASCIADFNHDDFINGNDFDDYIVAFGAGDPGADADGNGFVNGEDFDLFAVAFEAGC